MESARSCIVREGEGREAGVEEQSNKGRYLSILGKGEKKERESNCAENEAEHAVVPTRCKRKPPLFATTDDAGHCAHKEANQDHRGVC